MKKIVWLCMFFFLLAGCDLLENNKYKSFEMINTQDPLNERALIEQTMSKQQKLLKPGFITEQSNWKNGFELFSQRTFYNQGTKKLNHKVTYIHTPSKAYLPLVIKKDTNHEWYSKTVEQLKEAKPLQEIDGYYGYKKENGEKYYQYIAKKDGITYYFENERDEKEGIDEDLVSMIGNALKTEKDGAYSHFYDRFEFELDDLHFPQMDKEYVENVEIEIGDLGHWAFDNNNFIKVTYDFGNDTRMHFYNYGEDLYTPNESYTKTNEEETGGGETVTTFDTDEKSRTVYLWEADGHYYSIELESKNDGISTEDIYAIIDSSREDTREFSDENVFKSRNKGPTHSELDDDILQRLSDITDEQK